MYVSAGKAEQRTFTRRICTLDETFTQISKTRLPVRTMTDVLRGEIEIGPVGLPNFEAELKE